MMALLSMWLSAFCLFLSVGMFIYRPMMTDAVVAIDLWGCCLAMCFAGLLLWSYRKEKDAEPAVVMQRVQCTMSFVLSIIAAAIVYGLVASANRIQSG